MKFTTGKLDSDKHILKRSTNKLTRIRREFVGNKYIFQYDSCFANREIRVLEWPAKPPSLNIMENCWKEFGDDQNG